jgi:PKD repeat protein
VQLRVTDDEGATDTLDNPLTINVSVEYFDPVAYADADPKTQTVCEDIHFYDDGSYDPDGGLITKYEWDWNNDGTYDDTGDDVYHSFDTPGVYYVQFRVTDDEDATDELDSPIQVTIENAAPIAEASANKYEVVINESVDFDGSASYDGDCDGEEIVSYEWDFDYDGSFDVDKTGPTVSHSYTDPGVYYVQLRVTDDEGATDLLDSPLEITVLLSYCPTGIHSFGMERGISNHYSLMGYSVIPRADIAYIEQGVFGGRAIVQGGDNSLVIFDPDVDLDDPIDDGLWVIATGAGKGTVGVTSLDSAPYTNMVAVATSNKPSELRLLDTAVWFGDNVVYRKDFGVGTMIMAADFNSGGELYVVVKSGSAILLYSSLYAGEPDYYTSWSSKNIMASVGSEVDIFDIAVNWADDELFIFDAGVDHGSGPRGRVTRFSLADPLNPIADLVAEDLFGSVIQFVNAPSIGVAKFADIDIDHMGGDDGCHIVLHATVAGHTEVQKRDRTMLLLNADSPATYSSIWPSMAINPESNPLQRDLIMPGESKMGFWDAPSDW